jgi:hypothetical protein
LGIAQNGLQMHLRPRLGSQAGPSPPAEGRWPLRGAALGLLPGGSLPVVLTSFVGSLLSCALKLVSLPQRVALCGLAHLQGALLLRTRCAAVLLAAVAGTTPRRVAGRRRGAASRLDVVPWRRGLP